MRKSKENIQVVNNKKKFSIKTYIREFILFFYNKLFKCTGILFVIAVLLMAISIRIINPAVTTSDYDGLNPNTISLFGDYIERLKILVVIIVSGIVPYMYAPVVGYVCCLMDEMMNISYRIKEYGILVGVGASVIPLIINVIIISIITALGIYICRTITVSYRISNVKNMNYTNFRIKLYELVNKQDKVKALTKKREEKINKLTAKKEKIAYIQILNIAIIVCILQFVSVLIQHIFI